MSNIDMLLDQKVHRIFNFNQEICKSTDKCSLILRKSEDIATYPLGHYLEVSFNQESSVKVACDGFKKGPDIDGYIDSHQPPHGDFQVITTLDPEEYRICVLGFEVSSTPGISIIFLYKKDERGDNVELILYSDQSKQINNLILDGGGHGGPKIPPDTGLL